MADRFFAPRAAVRLARAASLSDDISRLPYVSGAREDALRRIGMHRIYDVLAYMPRRYLDFSHAYRIETAPLGAVCTIVATIDRVAVRPTKTHGLTVTELHLVDETGVLKVAFFRQPWLARELQVGDRLALMGAVEFSYGFKQMSSPHYEKLDKDASGSILPIHTVREGISQGWMRRIVAGALDMCGVFADPLHPQLRARRHLMSLSRAVRVLQFPHILSEVECARRRLSYDELIYLQLALRLRGDDNLLGIPAHAHRCGSHVERMIECLPFALTEEQRSAARDIVLDMMDGSHVMSRLLLGDVGTGKTAVACVALASVADSGTQACVMAPTGVLARQYAGDSGALLDACGISWALLTGATSASERSRIIEGLRAGSITVLFGTHAVLSDDVSFRDLSLVVIDEQHRFGVHQRSSLRSKGPGADLLVMTATPIPRTLALSVYGDLDTSIIRHRPVPGAGVTTQVIQSANRDIAYGSIRTALEAGHQAYVICPLVSKSDDEDELEDVPFAGREEEEGRPKLPLHSVDAETAHLRQLFVGHRVEMLHGKMRARDKDRVIEQFRQGDIDILVSTTVVEVGVNVPNATVMLIENGERFGLAALHQLRGRVGRGGDAGMCYISTECKRSRGKKSPALDRLEALERTSDGFELAEQDLRLRNEGEILGLRQHGGVTLRYVDLDRDADLIEWAHDDALELLTYAPSLNATATLPMRCEVVDRYGDIFKEVSGG